MQYMYVETHVNASPKKKGIKDSKDLELQNLLQEFPKPLTKRLVWRIVLGQYDLLGLISVSTIQLKLIMKKLAKEGKKVLWDEPVGDDIREEFLLVLQQLLVLKTLRFPRSVVPNNVDENEPPMLMTLADGSQSAFCALVYIRFKLSNGFYECRLVAGKTRVAPAKKISVPRMELMGTVTAVRLARSVREGLRFKVDQCRFFTDSSAVLGMLRGDSGSFLSLWEPGLER